MRATTLARERGTRAVLLAALAAALLGGCSARQIEDFFYAGGKMAYDSMKARQHAE